MTQTAIVMGQVGAAGAMRTSRRSVRSIGLLSNRFLVVAIALELALAVALVYLPGLNSLFHQGPLGPWHWAFLVIWAPVVFGAEELRKAALRARQRRRAGRTEEPSGRVSLNASGLRSVRGTPASHVEGAAETPDPASRTP
jgi:magnesium-transporting ATPase (P-type)